MGWIGSAFLVGGCCRQDDLVEVSLARAGGFGGMCGGERIRVGKMEAGREDLEGESTGGNFLDKSVGKSRALSLDGEMVGAMG